MDAKKPNLNVSLTLDQKSFSLYPPPSFSPLTLICGCLWVFWHVTTAPLSATFKPKIVGGRSPFSSPLVPFPFSPSFYLSHVHSLPYICVTSLSNCEIWMDVLTGGDWEARLSPLSAVVLWWSCRERLSLRYLRHARCSRPSRSRRTKNPPSRPAADPPT